MGFLDFINDAGLTSMLFGYLLQQHLWLTHSSTRQVGENEKLHHRVRVTETRKNIRKRIPFMMRNNWSVFMTSGLRHRTNMNTFPKAPRRKSDHSVNF